MDAVDESLGFLDENGKKALYYHVEKRCKIKRADIPQQLEIFQNALEELFGSGSRIIEKRAAKGLYEKFNLTFEEHQGWKIKEYAEHVQALIEKRAKR
jgi:hypothetical protein